jgi:WD40 repeat protein
MWDCETGQCLKIFRTHTVADVKFDSKQVITASFDNTAACWDMVTGERVRHYRGHIGAVFTVDYDEAVDILVTGTSPVIDLANHVNLSFSEFFSVNRSVCDPRTIFCSFCC